MLFLLICYFHYFITSGPYILLAYYIEFWCVGRPRFPSSFAMTGIVSYGAKRDQLLYCLKFLQLNNYIYAYPYLYIWCVIYVCWKKYHRSVTNYACFIGSKATVNDSTKWYRERDEITIFLHFPMLQLLSSYQLKQTVMQRRLISIWNVSRSGIEKRFGHWLSHTGPIFGMRSICFPSH